MAAAAVFLKVGRDAALGVRGFSRTPGWALALGGGGANRASTPDPRGDHKGRDVSVVVRLSPEKGHLGAQRGALWDPDVG